jgi:predicted PhzF superfamily epimerase YddE/YHI9
MIPIFLEALSKVPLKKLETCDFVYRFFAPGLGIPEDPATGSAQSSLAQFWRKHLGKTTVESLPLSRRIGTFRTKCKDDSIEIYGKAFLNSEGKIFPET